jgi:hypothetical protein
VIYPSAAGLARRVAAVDSSADPARRRISRSNVMSKLADEGEMVNRPPLAFSGASQAVDSTSHEISQPQRITDQRRTMLTRHDIPSKEM